MLLNIHWFIYLMIYLFIDSFLYSYIYLFIPSIIIVNKGRNSITSRLHSSILNQFITGDKFTQNSDQ